MTDQEIIEAEKLIADTRNVLTVLTGITDADKLVPHVLRYGPRVDENLRQLLSMRVVLRSAPPRTLQSALEGITIMMAGASAAFRNPDRFSADVVEKVGAAMRQADAALDKIAQELKTLRNH